ncbi:NmrA family NAD(P)-binding protein [Natronosporangium hydrolyticum]|uniref:NmrA family NAD(P)-binding protein n=1 Tax=Natronosporangium hydrolyticum TaxID=2811111 RepID=A0A895YBC7_9ACTN|nr:NmrA family NAD(P)-binding protein [Natronosporangium hydrolyticum]
MPRTVLITGATGTVSAALLRALRGTDLTLRALVRDESRAEQLAGRVAEVVFGDLDDPRSLPRPSRAYRSCGCSLRTARGPRRTT